MTTPDDAQHDRPSTARLEGPCTLADFAHVVPPDYVPPFGTPLRLEDFACEGRDPDGARRFVVQGAGTHGPTEYVIEEYGTPELLLDGAFVLEPSRAYCLRNGEQQRSSGSRVRSSGSDSALRPTAFWIDHILRQDAAVRRRMRRQVRTPPRDGSAVHRAEAAARNGLRPTSSFARLALYDLEDDAGAVQRWSDGILQEVPVEVRVSSVRRPDLVAETLRRAGAPRSAGAVLWDPDGLGHEDLLTHRLPTMTDLGTGSFWRNPLGDQGLSASELSFRLRGGRLTAFSGVQVYSAEALAPLLQEPGTPSVDSEGSGPDARWTDRFYGIHLVGTDMLMLCPTGSAVLTVRSRPIGAAGTCVSVRAESGLRRYSAAARHDRWRRRWGAVVDETSAPGDEEVAAAVVDAESQLTGIVGRERGRRRAEEVLDAILT